MYDNFYLVQRLEESSEGVQADQCRFGQLFELDYMGSAEFEFGAFPKFLRSINSANLKSLKTKIYNLEIFVVYDCDRNTEEFVLDQIKKVASDKIRLKASANFPPKNSAYAKTQAWAEIEYNVFWSLKDYRTMFKKMVQKSVEYMDSKK